MALELSPRAADRIPEAAGLVDQWYGRARRALPYLSARETGLPSGLELVQRRLSESGCVSAVAYERGAMAGFLVAAAQDLKPHEHAALHAHPRSAVVGLGGFAASAGREAEVLHELYVRVAARLVAERRLTHYVWMPADDAVAMAWFRLGFGLEWVHGLMPVKARGRQPREVGRLTIRRAGPSDGAPIGRMAVETARGYRQSAAFAPQPDEALAALRGHYTGALADPRSAAWIAVRGGEEVGMVVLTPAAPWPLVPPASVELAEAFVAPSARGEGVSRVLLATALAWAYDNGYRYVSARWRSGSPGSAGHWPRIGFKPVGHGLVRVLDPRLQGAR
jgi:GNAT superfamily N-acetyltransferase